MFKRNHLNCFFYITVITLIFAYPSLQVYGQSELDQKAAIVKNSLIKRHNQKGTWWTFYNFTSVPKNLKRSNNFFVGMLIVDLLQPFREDQIIDSLIHKTLDLSYENINPKNGFLRYYNRIDNLPEDSDDTGLFWYLAQSVDTTFVLTVIDSLQKYQTDNGLYLEWLQKGGIGHMSQTGTNPETIEIVPNIHVFLFLSKYNTLLAQQLCRSLQIENVISNPELWVYYLRAPWLYYIRQIDMVNNGCELKSNLPIEVRSLANQDIYEKISKLIRDFSLDNKHTDINTQASELLFQLSDNNFEYIKKNPMLIYHSDLSSKAPAYFWSYDIPYALWLRLYHEYKN